MTKANFTGVMSAITTKMTADQEVDLAAVQADVRFQIEGGVDKIIVCGSLGEASTLVADEKIAILDAALEAAAGKASVILTVAEDSTRAGAAIAKRAETSGAYGLMVLPAMRYISDRRETMTHFRTVASASRLPIIVYNNPVAYIVDVTPDMFAEMADEPKFVGIKESSADLRRITDIINLTGDRYQLSMGVDDLALEAMMLGCVGWIAGLVVAFPRETVTIYELAKAGRYTEARELYRWFFPLLHLDVSVRFVQNIKLVENMIRGTSVAVRTPRLPLVGAEEAHVRKVVSDALAIRPDLSRYSY